MRRLDAISVRGFAGYLAKSLQGLDLPFESLIARIDPVSARLR